MRVAALRQKYTGTMYRERGWALAHSSKLLMGLRAEPGGGGELRPYTHGASTAQAGWMPVMYGEKAARLPAHTGLLSSDRGVGSGASMPGRTHTKGRVERGFCLALAPFANTHVWESYGGRGGLAGAAEAGKSGAAIDKGRGKQKVAAPKQREGEQGMQDV